MAADPGRGRAAPGTLRGDLDVLSQEMRAIDLRLAVAEAGWQEALDRLAKLEAVPAAAGASAELRAVADDLGALRESIHGELLVVDAQLAELRRRRSDELSAPAAAAGAPPTQEDEDRWATLALDADAGVRFSALFCLGGHRSERSVQVSIDRLGDEDFKVVWQAIRNLGKFRETDAASGVAQHLDHAEAVVRAAACDALLAMGAPKDTGFVATAGRDARRAAADKLRRWCESH